MIIGVPSEIKVSETKVPLIPLSVKSLIDAGNRVLIQKNAGAKASFSDSEYKQNGAEIVETAEEIYQKSDIVLKINQPQSSEYELLKPNQIIMGMFNLLENEDLTHNLLSKKITAIDIKKIKTKNGIRPIDNAISEITGKAIIRIVSSISEKYNGGRLICSTTGLKPLQVTVVGSGAVGLSAAKTAAALGCNIFVLDNDIDKLQQIELLYHNQINTLFSNRGTIEDIIPRTDILICAVKSDDTEILIREDDIKRMKKGSIVVDTGLASENTVVETMDRILPINSPICEKYGVLHYCFDNITTLVANTISSAISEILTNYLLVLTEYDNFADILKHCGDLIESILTYEGNITEEILAEHYFMEKYELSMLTGF